ncbi:hypothetical protein [Novosphingobium pituita]|jgi:hypothetical protein|nr:hypothetical protein [Novosphingobium sp. IK01]
MADKDRDFVGQESFVLPITQIKPPMPKVMPPQPQSQPAPGKSKSDK